MAINLRSNRTMAVGALATCAVIGASSPVWAGSGSPSAASDQPNAATIANLRSEVAQLTSALQTDQSALVKERAAVASAVHAAHEADQFAAREANKAHKAKAAKARAFKDHGTNLTRAVTSTGPADIAVPMTDSRATGHPCHHGFGDPSHANDGHRHNGGWRH
jgi:hypothetical protein